MGFGRVSHLEIKIQSRFSLSLARLGRQNIASRAPHGRLSQTVLGVVCVIVLVQFSSAASKSAKRDPHSNLALRSSDARLVQAFTWAKQQAMAYVFDDDPVGPWYEAALPGRQAFCMRDVSHQAAGAQALGLSKYTHNMLHRFAENISESKDWCSYWEINRENLPAPVDYKSDTEFWYNLPANFDVLDTCYRMYLWTGDRTYLDDPVFLNFYARSIADYVARWDLGLDRVMEREVEIKGPPYWRGDPTYEEGNTDVAVGIDLLAAQYAAYRAFAAIQAIRGDLKRFDTYEERAAGVKALVNTAWWDSAGSYFHAFLNKNHSFRGRAGADLLYWDVAEDGPKVEGALQALRQSVKTEAEDAVEGKSHYAEILYRYGVSEDAYSEAMDLTRRGRVRREYPEVSYSVIGAIANGLMGINVKPASKLEDVAHGQRFEIVVRTLPQLTARTRWAELRNVPVQNSIISVRHQGVRRTSLTNNGTTALTWEAAFPGSFETLIVNGRPLEAHSETEHSRRISWVRVPVCAGCALSIEIPR